MEFASDIFIEALRHMLSPIYPETIAYAMHGFGGYDMALPVVLAVLGGMAGVLLLWTLGRGLFHLAQRVGFAPGRYEKLHGDMHRYGMWMLLLVWLPVGFAIALGAGFFNIRLRVAVPLALAGLAGHYGWVLMG